jgi:hypothetical protein
MESGDSQVEPARQTKRSSPQRSTSGGEGGLNRVQGATLAALLVALAVLAAAHPAVAYSPRLGDSFSYSENTTVNNGQGSYAGYADQTQTTGVERVTLVDANVVSSYYVYSYQYNNSQGNSTSGSSSGSYTWSSGNFTYLNGTDHQVGYSKPVYVWFAMNSSLPVGAAFQALNTQFTVLSTNYSLLLPTERDQYVQTIETEGTGQYQRDDSYGAFTASYTWHEYFDRATGYIVGYDYVEHDNGQYQGQPGGFTYNDTLYVTKTSYPLALASGHATTALNGGGLGSYDVYLAAVLVAVLVIAVAAYAISRRRRRRALPKHSAAPVTPPPAQSSEPWESKVGLGSKPPEQVVIREVAEVNCKYCGTLIPTTAQTCPVCGGPRQ